MSQDGITQIEGLNNTIELLEEILEEVEIAIYNAEDKIDIICNALLAFDKKELGKYIKDFELYNDIYIKDTIMNFVENNMYEIDEDYLFLELEPNEKLLYALITALSNKEGYCYASNKYLGES